MRRPDHDVRNAGIESGLVGGHPAAWGFCLDLVRAAAPGSGPLLLLVGLLGGPREHEAIIAALAQESLSRDAAWALGFAGTRAAADACIELIAQDLHPRVAAEALGAITGLDLVRENLALPETVDESEDAPVVLPTPDDLLPLPDPSGLIRWWNDHRKSLADGQRYVAGKPRNAAAVQAALESGPTRRRHALSLEMAIRTSRLYLLSTTAFSAQQRREMTTFGALKPADMTRHPQSRLFSPL
jgi:uncharacterized protein (TIGR02270 family)